MKDIILFYSHEDEYGYLSNWYPSIFVCDGIQFSTSEQYMMYKKAMLFNDNYIADKILHTTDPLSIKKLGRKVKPFDRDAWDNNKVDIIYRGLVEKFNQNSDIKEKLLSTGDSILAEASPWDTIWGIGYSKQDIRSKDINHWRGENLLGYTLMRVRDDIRKC